jgi:hypothetical protein
MTIPSVGRFSRIVFGVSGVSPPAGAAADSREILEVALFDSATTAWAGVGPALGLTPLGLARVIGEVSLAASAPSFVVSFLLAISTLGTGIAAGVAGVLADLITGVSPGCGTFILDCAGPAVGVAPVGGIFRIPSLRRSNLGGRPPAVLSVFSAITNLHQTETSCLEYIRHSSIGQTQNTRHL